MVSIMTDYDTLLRKLEGLQTLLEDSEYLYAYIAPKDREEFFTFLNGIYNSTAPKSLYRVLSNPETVRNILKNLGFLGKTELEIYVSKNDQFSSTWWNLTLKEYLAKENLRTD
jgi:hypothetical protein